MVYVICFVVFVGLVYGLAHGPDAFVISIAVAMGVGFIASFLVKPSKGR